VNRSDFQALARLRSEDARCLLENGRFDGAYYLAGYVVECALKACIARNVQQYDFPDRDAVNRSYTHNLNQLLEIAGLRAQLAADGKADTTLLSNWNNHVTKWSERSRYETHGQAEARELYDAVSDPAHGVFQWLLRHW